MDIIIHHDVEISSTFNIVYDIFKFITNVKIVFNANDTLILVTNMNKELLIKVPELQTNRVEQ